MIKQKILLLLLFIIITACGNTTYTHHFKKGRMIDFSQGKWLLNHPFTNHNPRHIDDLAAKHFERFLGDSLSRITKMENGNVIAAHLPFDPSPEQLKAARVATGHDFLINVQSHLGRNEMGSFAHAPAMGSTVKTNGASSKIRIYNLHTGEMISETSTTGVAEVLKSEGDKNWDYVNSAQTIAVKSLKRLIKQYRKNGITN